MNILLAVTGSVAATLTHELVRQHQTLGEVRVIFTPSGIEFANKTRDVWALEGAVWYEKELDWTKKGDPILHIELAKWADVLVVAPCSANSLAKFAHGIADNLVTCVFRAWDFREGKPVVLAPAMNTKMWDNRPTRVALEELARFGDVNVVKPTTKTLACGDTGVGAMADIEDIVQTVEICCPLPCHQEKPA